MYKNSFETFGVIEEQLILPIYKFTHFIDTSNYAN